MPKNRHHPTPSRQQLAALAPQTPFKTGIKEPPYLVISGVVLEHPFELNFYKKGGFSVREQIAYEHLASSYNVRTLEVMVVARQIANDLNMTYQEAITLLDDNQNLTTVLMDYADRLLEIGLLDFSDTARKLDTAHMFITMRANSNWRFEQSEELLTEQLQQIYVFMTNEQRGWKKPPEPLESDEEVGKRSQQLGSPLNPQSPMTGQNATTTSSQPGSQTPDSAPTSLENSSLPP